MGKKFAANKFETFLHKVGPISFQYIYIFVGGPLLQALFLGNLLEKSEHGPII